MPDIDERGLTMHMGRVMRNEVKPAPEVGPWERIVEGVHWRGVSLWERWWCWDDVQGRWRPYWRHHGSLPRWARQ